MALTSALVVGPVAGDDAAMLTHTRASSHAANRVPLARAVVHIAWLVQRRNLGQLLAEVVAWLWDPLQVCVGSEALQVVISEGDWDSKRADAQHESGSHCRRTTCLGAPMLMRDT
eukprot:1404838-Amphidinium_carterae.1